MRGSPIFRDTDSSFIQAVQLVVWLLSIIGLYFVWKRLSGYSLRPPYTPVRDPERPDVDAATDGGSSVEAVARLRAAFQGDEIGLDVYDAAVRQIGAGDDPDEVLDRVLG